MEELVAGPGGLLSRGLLEENVTRSGALPRTKQERAVLAGILNDYACVQFPEYAKSHSGAGVVGVAVGRGANMTRENSRYWREFRAFAEDSTGKRYSKKTTTCPSWGEGDGFSFRGRYISRMREQLKDAGLDPAAYFSFEKDPEGFASKVVVAPKVRSSAPKVFLKCHFIL